MVGDLEDQLHSQVDEGLVGLLVEVLLFLVHNVVDSILVSVGDLTHFQWFVSDVINRGTMLTVVLKVEVQGVVIHQ